MEKQIVNQLTFLFVFILVNGGFVHAQTNQKYCGTYEGKFMGDFRAVLDINANDENRYSGKIMMYAGEQQIQNDPLEEIAISQKNITFQIPAKETNFEGTFNEQISELSGFFIFPDGSKHPIMVNKKSVQENVSEGSGVTWKEMKTMTYAKKELEEDLVFLIEKLQENHPQLYGYTSKITMETMIHEAKNSIEDEMTLLEYFNIICPIVESVKCSHTGIRLPKEFQDEMLKNVSAFPLKLAFKGEHAYDLSASTSTKTSTPPGSEILSINGMPINKLLDQLFMYIPSEGQNTTSKYNELNRNMEFYLPMVLDSERYKIEYLEKGEKQTASVKGIKHEVLSNDIHKQVPLDFYMDFDNEVGFLKIQSFTFPDIERYIQLTDSIFQMLSSESIAHLVLDLRDNRGGHPIFAAQLLSYLTDHEFTYFKRNEKIPDFEPLYLPMLPNSIQFHGQLYVLVNGGCLSTTGHLISLLKYHTNARFLGEEPGSTYTCNDFSAQFDLPNTGIKANIPRTTFATAVSGDAAQSPFLPDYPIEPTIQSMIVGQDAYMDSVNHLIHQNQ